MKKLLLTLMLCLVLISPAIAARWVSVTLLDAVTSAGASTDIDAQNWEEKTLYIVASSVTTGGTVLVQTSPDNSNWVTISTTSVTANGTTEVAVSGMLHRYIRANLSARTDGTYTVTMYLHE